MQSSRASTTASTTAPCGGEPGGTQEDQDLDCDPLLSMANVMRSWPRAVRRMQTLYGANTINHMLAVIMAIDATPNYMTKLRRAFADMTAGPDGVAAHEAACALHWLSRKLSLTFDHIYSCASAEQLERELS